MRTSKFKNLTLLLLLASLAAASPTAQADTAIFSSPSGDAIGLHREFEITCEKFKPDGDNVVCVPGRALSDFSLNTTVRLSIEATAGLAKGRDSGTLGYGSLRADGVARVQNEGSEGYVSALAQGTGRISFEAGDGGVPLYQVKLMAAGTGMATLPLGGVLVAVDANKFRRFSETFAEIGYTQAFQVRLRGIDYVLVRFNYALKNGEVNIDSKTAPELAKAMTIFSKQTGQTGDFPFDTHWGATTIKALEGQFLLKLAKFAINVDVSMGNDDESRANPNDIPADAFAPSKLDRFETYASVVLPLKVLFPNDALKFEGQFVSYAMHGTVGGVEAQQLTTSDRYLGVSYGFSW